MLTHNLWFEKLTDAPIIGDHRFRSPTLMVQRNVRKRDGGRERLGSAGPFLGADLTHAT